MQHVHRGIGKLRARSADDTQISILLNDFEALDQTLRRIGDSAKAWRDSWTGLLNSQLLIARECHVIYSPITAASDHHHAGPAPIETPKEKLGRMEKMMVVYGELKDDITEELKLLDSKVILPVTEVQDVLNQFRKAIKKRETKKLDYEYAQGKYDTSVKKLNRTEREKLAFSKLETELERTTADYHAADDHLKSTLRPVVTAAFSILPELLTAQVLIHNSLLAQYYTIVHNFCQDEGFPSPAPPMEDVIRHWNDQFDAVRNDVETRLITISQGRAIRQPLHQNRSDSKTSLMAGGGTMPYRPSPRMVLFPPSQTTPSPATSEMVTRPPSSRASSQTLVETASSNNSTISNSLTPGSVSTTSQVQTFSPAGPNMDYFARDRLASSPRTAPGVGVDGASSPGSSTLAAIKKKPPPPPPRKLPQPPEVWVTALYDFDGVNEGDLRFSKGDRIKVIKQTDSMNDWWQGELRQTVGSFPANYCTAS